MENIEEASQVAREGKDDVVGRLGGERIQRRMSGLGGRG